MYVCMYIHTYTCVCVCVEVVPREWKARDGEMLLLHMCDCKHVHVYLCMCTRVFEYVRLCVCMRARGGRL